ncbi:MAG: dihydrofolate reductase family protein [Gemmatimonadales bacterium]
MARLLVSGFTMSVDGYGAGLHQSRENPLGVGGEDLHDWLVNTPTFTGTYGGEGGNTGIDEDFAARSMAGIGAWIMGRNMFGPIRGPWPDESWRGWWGANPPYHTPVFVLTHHARAAVTMESGTVFHFVTEGIHAALEQARAAAGQATIRLGGGVATIRQYLQARLVDEMHVPVAPIFLGSGEPLFAGLDLPALGYRVARFVASERAAHFVIARS